jgi:hypothetical protein
MKKKYCIFGMVLISTVGFAKERFIQGTGTKSACVIDAKSHLMLVKSPPITKYNWKTSHMYVNGLKLCGFSDWRLPTKEEQIELQQNIGSYAAFAWFNTHGFDNIQTDFYWSGDSYTKDNNDAWGIYMYSSKVYNEPKSSLNYIWPVRKL